MEKSRPGVEIARKGPPTLMSETFLDNVLFLKTTFSDTSSNNNESVANLLTRNTNNEFCIEFNVPKESCGYFSNVNGSTSPVNKHNFVFLVQIQLPYPQVKHDFDRFAYVKNACVKLLNRIIIRVNDAFEECQRTETILENLPKINNWSRSSSSLKISNDNIHFGTPGNLFSNNAESCIVPVVFNCFDYTRNKNIVVKKIDVTIVFNDLSAVSIFNKDYEQAPSLNQLPMFNVCLCVVNMTERICGENYTGVDCTRADTVGLASYMYTLAANYTFKGSKLEKDIKLPPHRIKTIYGQLYNSAFQNESNLFWGFNNENAVLNFLNSFIYDSSSAGALGKRRYCLIDLKLGKIVTTEYVSIFSLEKTTATTYKITNNTNASHSLYLRSNYNWIDLDNSVYFDAGGFFFDDSNNMFRGLVLNNFSILYFSFALYDNVTFKLSTSQFEIKEYVNPNFLTAKVRSLYLNESKTQVIGGFFDYLLKNENLKNLLHMYVSLPLTPFSRPSQSYILKDCFHCVDKLANKWDIDGTLTISASNFYLEPNKTYSSNGNSNNILREQEKNILTFLSSSCCRNIGAIHTTNQDNYTGLDFCSINKQIFNSSFYFSFSDACTSGFLELDKTAGGTLKLNIDSPKSVFNDAEHVLLEKENTIDQFILTNKLGIVLKIFFKCQVQD